MKALFHAIQTANLLRNARIGGIIAPDQLRSELGAVKELPPIANFAIEASVPNWLIEKLDPRLPMAPHYQVFPTLDRRDVLLLATLQCANVQLRCVMQLSDPKVQDFLSDALDQGLFTVLFYIENTKQNAVLGVPFDLADPQALRRHMKEAKRCSDGLAPAVQLTNLASHTLFQPSLIAGHTVDDVVAILAGTPTAQEVNAALGEEPQDPTGASRTSLH
ncbi:hypothetical protein [Roseateles violae]|uniref:Uncharacterized protein n=1 Tax=Roseateles violae TaxID=3058042 RepID=A0ABT8DJX5_9BURK|nr:hypothetical protein [Pelomonas sp. PFR6]MDN3918731.1 hypothetical protein [Pelomonas sp. PFR6]